MGRRVVRLVLVASVAVGLIWVGWTWWSARRYRSAMAAIDSEMAAGRFGKAARDLETVLAARPRSDEAAYILGTCEQARGRQQEADQAWTRVTPGSAFFRPALTARVRFLHDTGRLAAAENLIIESARDPRNDRTDLLVLLGPIYSRIGRSDEAERLVEARWEHLNATGAGTPEQSVTLVRLHIELTWRAPSVEDLRVYLDQAGRLAPDDDRVWLGRANRALRTGAYDESQKWLTACQRRRPDDFAVSRAWLNWGIATGRVDVVQEASRRLPAAESTPAQVHRLNAWLRSRRGDVEAERQELERLIAVDPADRKALDRLTQLAEKDGQPARAAAFQSKKVEIDRLSARYEKLYERTQHMRDAAEMARLAETLGRDFEARVFLTLAVSEEPEREDLRRDLARVNQRRAPQRAHGQALADVLDTGPGMPGESSVTDSR